MMFIPFEPKVAFRHMVLSLDNIPAFVIKAVGMPEIDNGEIVIDYINVDFKVKGKSRWQDISITLYDPVVPSAAQAVHNWINMHHNSSTGIDGWAFQEYKRDVSVHALDPKGSPVEMWTLHGAFIGSSNWGSMDWSTDEAKTIELNIKYDYATLG